MHRAAATHHTRSHTVHAMHRATATRHTRSDSMHPTAALDKFGSSAVTEQSGGVSDIKTQIV